MTNLQYLYENDQRALQDFVLCNSHCDDCRARSYCDDFAKTDMAEWEYLLMESEWGERAPDGEMREAAPAMA